MHPPPLRGADRIGGPAPRRRGHGHPQRRHRLDRCRPRRLGSRAHRLAPVPGQRPRRPRGDHRRRRQRGGQPPARPLGRPPARRPRRLPGLRLPGQPRPTGPRPSCMREPAGTTRSSPPSPSEDSLAGDTADPPSRHLYAYGAGDPVDRADVSGTHWLRVSKNTTWSLVALSYYGSTIPADALRRDAWNGGAEGSSVMAGVKYRLPEVLTVGTRAYYHRVWGRDDPLSKVDGWAFGSPYYSIRPIVLSPHFSTCPASSCAGPDPWRTGVRLPGWGGTWRQRLGWRSGQHPWIIIGVDTGPYRVPVPLGFRADLMASEDRLDHASLVTVWLSYDLQQLEDACMFLAEACPIHLAGRYHLEGGSGSARWDYTSPRVTLWREGSTRTAEPYRNPLNPPMATGYVHVWVPRAARPLRKFGFEGVAGLDAYGIPFRNLAPANSRTLAGTVR